MNKVRNFFAALSAFATCINYINVSQCMDNIRKSNKLSMNLLSKIFKFKNFTEEEKTGLILLEILRLRRNMGIPECHLKIDINGLPNLIQYTVLLTYNSLLENNPEFKNYIQGAYLKKGHHNFAILGTRYKSASRVEKIFEPYLGNNLKGSQTVVVKNPVNFLGMVVDFNNYTVLTINNPELHENSKGLMQDYLQSFGEAKYANGKLIIDEVKKNLDEHNIKYDNEMLSVLYAMFNAIHEFGHLLHECKCVTSGIIENYILGEKPYNIEISIAYKGYFSGDKFKKLFTNSEVAKTLLNSLETKNYDGNLFTEYGIESIPKRGYSELWADSFALSFHPFTNKNDLRDQFVDDFFHLDKQHDINILNKNKKQRADHMRQWNYLIKAKADNLRFKEAQSLFPLIKDNQFPEFAINYLANQFKLINDYEQSSKYTDEDISNFEC